MQNPLRARSCSASFCPLWLSWCVCVRVRWCACRVRSFLHASRRRQAKNKKQKRRHQSSHEGWKRYQRVGCELLCAPRQAVVSALFSWSDSSRCRAGPLWCRSTRVKGGFGCCCKSPLRLYVGSMTLPYPASHCAPSPYPLSSSHKARAFRSTVTREPASPPPTHPAASHLSGLPPHSPKASCSTFFVYLETPTHSCVRAPS